MQAIDTPDQQGDASQSASAPSDQPVSGRILWVDVAKALGILIVFHGHFVEQWIAPGVPGAQAQMKWIYAFHMPLFFLLSGYVHKARDWSTGEFLSRQIYSRLVPVWVFNVLGMLVWAGLTLAHGELQGAQIVQQAQRDGFQTFVEGRPVWNILTWFLVCLFVTELMQFALERFTRRNWALAASMLVFAALAALAEIYSETLYNVLGVRRHWWHLSSAIMALAFYQAGILIRRWNWFTAARVDWRDYALAFGALLVTLFTFNRNDLTGITTRGVVIMKDARFGEVGWFFLTCVAGILFIIALSRVSAKSEWLGAIGRITLPLMLLNGVMDEFTNGPLADALMHAIPGMGLTSCVIVSVVVTIASIAVCVPISHALQIYTPFMLGMRRKRS